MIPIYVPDTSALLKRYFDEAGSERMDELFEEASQGALEICLIPIVRYEIIARLKRVENAIRNRSAGRLPLLRTATSGHAQSIAQLRRAYTNRAGESLQLPPWYITTSASAWRGSPPSTTGVGASDPLGHQARQEPTPDAHTNHSPNPCKGNTPETPGRCKHWARFAIQLYLIRRN